VLIAGFSYERAGEYFDMKRYKPVGKMIDINGHDMHIFTKGNGKATVVFASGWGTPSPYSDFYPLYNEISKYAKVAVYDRPGYGWSDVADTPRNIDTITKEIHSLLKKSGQRGPYIFVGHSLASLEVIRFAQMYKKEVKGIVMIDSGNPEYYAKEDMNGVGNASLISIMRRFGVFRLLFKKQSFVSSVYEARSNLSLVPKKLKEIDEAMYLKNMENKNLIEENKNIKLNAAKVVASGKLGSIPLRILTSGSEADSDSKWKTSQEQFKNWSSNSKQMIVPNAKHFIHQYAPQVVNQQIMELLNRIKR
jgi:pimeloyl-ACP methyl ester carboxylesterase